MVKDAFSGWFDLPSLLPTRDRSVFAHHDKRGNCNFQTEKSLYVPHSPVFVAFPSSIVLDVTPPSSEVLTLKISVFGSINSLVVTISVFLPWFSKLELYVHRLPLISTVPLVGLAPGSESVV